MHKNRKLDLKQYQHKLEERVNKLAFLIQNKETNKIFLYKPKVKSMWHNKFIKDYANERYYKLKERLNKKDCRMITLTYSTKKYTPEQVAKRHKSDIKKFFRLIRKEIPLIQYCYFIELTKKLMIHFHIYVDRFIHQKVIKEIWTKITGNFIVDIRLVSTPEQIKYCSSYHQIMKKYNHRQLEFAWKNISRFFGQSRNFFSPAEKVLSAYHLLGRVKFAGVNLLEYFNLKDINWNLIVNIEKINDELEDIFFDCVLNDKNGFYYVFGAEPYSPDSDLESVLAEDDFY